MTSGARPGDTGPSGVAARRRSYLVRRARVDPDQGPVGVVAILIGDILIGPRLWGRDRHVTGARMQGLVP